MLTGTLKVLKPSIQKRVPWLYSMHLGLPLYKCCLKCPLLSNDKVFCEVPVSWSGLFQVFWSTSS